MKTIIVVTYPESPWLSDCIASLEGVTYPVTLCINPKGESAYDTAAFYFAREHNIKEFIILHDSMVIKDISLFDKVFALPGNVSMSNIRFLMCFGKYELDKIPTLPPKPKNKREAVEFESGFVRHKVLCDSMFAPLNDTNVFENKHGKKRMILENDYIKKYKGCWNPDMI